MERSGRIALVSCVLLGASMFACSGSKSQPDAEVKEAAEPRTTEAVAASEPEGGGQEQVEDEQPAVKPAGDFCVPEGELGFGACVDKKVSLTGPRPKMEYQHPMMTDPMNGNQLVIEVNERQVIVTSSAPAPACETYVVKGALGRIDMGGEEGTKGSYSGYVVRGAEIVCGD